MALNFTNMAYQHMSLPTVVSGGVLINNIYSKLHQVQLQ